MTREQDTVTRVRNRRQAYQLLFLGADGELSPEARLFFADMKRFCYAKKSTTKVSPQTGMVDTHASFQAEGRREVWNRMTEYLHLDDRQITNITEG